MSMTKFNRKKPVEWEIDTTGWDYIKLSDLEPGVVYVCNGMFITRDTGYGEGAVLIADGCLVNIPSRYCPDIKEACADRDQVDDIKAGKVGFMYTLFKSKYGRDGYSLEWVDIE